MVWYMPIAVNKLVEPEILRNLNQCQHTYTVPELPVNVGNFDNLALSSTNQLPSQSGSQDLRLASSVSVEGLYDRGFSNLIRSTPLLFDMNKHFMFPFPWQNSGAVHIEATPLRSTKSSADPETKSTNYTLRSISGDIKIRKSNEANKKRKKENSKPTHADKKRKTDYHKSEYRGVYFNSSTRIYRARIHHNKRSEHLGNFSTEIEAARAYDKRAKELGRKHLNFAESGEK